MGDAIFVEAGSSSLDMASPTVGKSNTRFQCPWVEATDCATYTRPISSAIAKKGLERAGRRVHGMSGAKRHSQSRRRRAFAKTAGWVGARLAPLLAERLGDQRGSLSAEFLGHYLAMKWPWNRRSRIMKKRVEFDAHKIVRKRTEVEFTTKGGKDVDFMANKKAKIPVHVRFKANVK